MKFQVPQFIEVETKIFGPLTLKQFLYLAGGAGITIILYSVLPFFLMIIFAAPVVALALALAFYKVNNQPFVRVLEHAIKFYLSGRLFLWKKTPNQNKNSVRGYEEKSASGGMQMGGTTGYVPKLTQSKLKDLSWSLDINKES